MVRGVQKGMVWGGGQVMILMVQYVKNSVLGLKYVKI